MLNFIPTASHDIPLSWEKSAMCTSASRSHNMNSVLLLLDKCNWSGLPNNSVEVLDFVQ